MNQFILVGKILETHEYKNDVADIKIEVLDNGVTNQIYIRLNDFISNKLENIEMGWTIAVKGEVSLHGSGSIQLVANKLMILDSTTKL